MKRNDDGREIFTYMQTFAQYESFPSRHTFNVQLIEEEGEEKNERKRLFNIICPKKRDEVNVKTLTNTIYAINKEETFFSFFFFIILSYERKRILFVIVVQLLRNQGGHVQISLDRLRIFYSIN